MLVEIGRNGGAPKGSARASQLSIPPGATVCLIQHELPSIRCWTGSAANPVEKGFLYVERGKPTMLRPQERISLNVGDEHVRAGVRFELLDPVFYKTMKAVGFEFIE
jgi:hypothetical protein